MNEKLANILIELTEPANLREFLNDPDGFVAPLDLSEVDKLALVSRNRNSLSYQARFGDLSLDRLRNNDFSVSHVEVEHVVVGPEHDHDDGLTGGAGSGTETQRTFGPYARWLDQKQ